MARRQAFQSKQNYSCMDFALAEHQLAKILVASDEEFVCSVGLIENLTILCPRRHLGDIGDLVGVLTKPLHDRSIHALVGQELHADCLVIG